MLLCMARIIFLWMFSVLWCRLSSPCAAQPALWCSFPTLTPLVTRCPSAPLLQQPWLCGLWPRQWHKAPHLEGSCTWVNTLLSSSWNSSSFMNKRLHIFSLLWALQMMWSTLCRRKGLLDFIAKKKKSLRAECSVQYFLWFLRNHFLFSILSYPPGLAAGCMRAALLNLWCSFPAHLQCFHNSRTGASPPGPNLLPWPWRLFLLLLLPPWTWHADCSSPPSQSNTLMTQNLLCHQNVTCILPLCSILCFSFCLECFSSFPATLWLSFL